jgi:hypothetical protein
VVLLLAVAAALFFVGSRAARELAATRLMAALRESTGRPVTVGALDFGLLPLTLDVYDLVIPGPTPRDPVVARVPFARVQLSWQTLRRREVRIEQIDVERPFFYLEIRPDGTTNLPLPRSRRGAGPSRFTFSIGRALVQGGTFKLNEIQLPLEVDAKAIWGRMVGRAPGRLGKEPLELTAAAQEVVTSLPDARPYPMSFAAHAELLGNRLAITEARAASPELRARTRGEISWGEQGTRVDLTFVGGGETALINRLGYLADPIAGRFDATARYLAAPGQPWRFDGRVRSPGLEILDRKVADLESAFRIDSQRVAFDVEKARYSGGSVKGPVVVDLAAASAPGKGRPVDLDLQVTGLSVRQFLAEQFPEELGGPKPVVELAARGSGRVRYRFLSSAPLAGRGAASLILAPAAGERGLPVGGALPLELQAGVLKSGPLHLISGAQAIDGGFSFDLVRGRGSADYRLASADLGGLAPLLPAPPPGEKPAFWWPSAGRGTAGGRVEIEGSRYTAQVELDLAPVVAPALAADRVTGVLTLTPEAVSGLRLDVTRGTGSLRVTGSVPIPAPGKTNASGLQIGIEAARFPLRDAGYFLDDLGLAGASGEATGRIDLAGDLDRFTGTTRFAVDGFALPMFPAGAAIDRLEATVTFDGDRVTVERGVAETPAGVVLVSGSFSQNDPQAGRLDLMVDAPVLALDRPPLRDLIPSDLGGELVAQAVISGTGAHPMARTVIAGRRLTLAGKPLGQGTAQVDAIWDGTSLTASGGLGELLDFEGGGPLDVQAADLRFDLRRSDLGGLVSLGLAQPLADFKGSFLGTVGVRADFAAGTSDVRLRLADLRAEYLKKRLVNLDPVEIHLGTDQVTIDRLYLGEPGGGAELFVGGGIRLPQGDKQGSLDLKILSTLPVSWAELALPDAEPGGSLDVLATVRGSFDQPLISGQAELKQGRFLFPFSEFPLTIEDASATLVFDSHSRQLNLESFRARLGNSGTLRASGNLDLASLPDHPSYLLRAAVQGVSGMIDGLTLRGDADLVFASTAEGRRVSGSVQLDRAFYLQNLGLYALKLLRTALEQKPLLIEDTDSFLATTQLNVRVAGVDDALRVNNDLANLRGDIDLVVRGTLARPVVFGSVVITPGGTLRYADNEYTVERGSLAFSNPYRIDPVIDLVARTKVQRFDITVDFNGTLERLDTKFYSNSDLADLEILTLLATGSQPLPENESALESQPDGSEQLAARSILQGQLTGAVAKRVGTLFGFDRFRIDPVGTEGGQTLSSVGLTVGKRLTRDIFVTYTTDPAQRRNVVQVEWQLGKGVTLVATQNDQTVKSYSVDIQWEKRY